MNAEVIYVMECEKERFYVGRCKTQRLPVRLSEHFNGSGCAFTKKYKCIRHAGPARAMKSDFDEDNKVKDLMRIHGIERVRGGSYSQLELDDAQIEVLQRELLHSEGRCFGCGAVTHFYKECSERARRVGAAQTPERKWTPTKKRQRCFRCGQVGHSAPDCGFGDSESSGSESEDGDYDDRDVCFRCGRPGHWANECRASEYF